MTDKIDHTEFVRRVDAYARAADRTRSTISLKLFNDGKVVDRLADGGDVYWKKLEAAKIELAALEREAGIKTRR